MKISNFYLFFLIVLLHFLSCTERRNSPKNEASNNPAVVDLALTTEGFNTCSLYSRFEWSESLQAFYSKFPLFVFNNQLAEIYHKKLQKFDFLKLYKNQTIGIGGFYKYLFIVNLKTGEIINKTRLPGQIKSIQLLENNQILVIEKKNETSHYRHFFQETELIKTDSIEVGVLMDHDFLFSYSANSELLGYINQENLVIRDLKKNTEKKISGKFRSRPVFSQDHSRVLSVEKSDVYGRNNMIIYSYPELEKIATYQFRNINWSFHDNKMVIGDDTGKLQVIDLVSGEVIMNYQGKRIYAVGINSLNEIAYMEKINNQIYFVVRNYITHKVISLLETSR